MFVDFSPIFLSRFICSSSIVRTVNARLTCAFVRTRWIKIDGKESKVTGSKYIIPKGALHFS